MTDEQRERIAHHEAAHAVIAVRLGATVTDAVVGEEAARKLSDGKFCPDPGGNMGTAEPEGFDIQDSVCITLAGLAYEVVFRGLAERTVWNYLDARTEDPGRAVANAKKRGVEDPVSFVTDRWWVAKRLVRKHRKLIDQVARRLLLDSELDGKEVHEMVRVYDRRKRYLFGAAASMLLILVLSLVSWLHSFLP